jgi:hypothetical protein
MINKLISLNSALIILLCLFINLPAQDSVLVHEISGSVPELEEFHNVIYEIWHNAYPNKDYNALRSYVNEVNAYAAKVYDARLPGILRDKETKWQDGLAELKIAVENYNTAASGTDNEQLLNAAEALHAKFEMMVRIIKPVLKEVDDFHKVLYVVYHKYLPEKNYEKIKSACEELKLKAEAIINAKPTKKMEARMEQFKNASNELVSSVNTLSEICKGNDIAAIDSAVEDMHTKYQKLEAVFD